MSGSFLSFPRRILGRLGAVPQAPPPSAVVVIRSWSELVELSTQVVVSRAAAYLEGELVEELLAVSGSVSADCRRGTMRTCTVSFAPADGDFDALYDLLRTPGLEILVRRGFVVSGGEEMRDLGRYLIDSVTMKEGPAGREISVACSDVSVRIQRAPWLDPYQIAAGTNLATAITNLLASRYRSVQIGATFAAVTTVMAAAAVLGAGGGSSNPWADAQAIADAHGYVLYMDASGVAQLITPPDPRTSTPSYVYKRGAAALITERTRTFPAERTYNGVIVSGEGTGVATPVRGESWITNARDPMSIYGPLGYRPLILSSSLITTTAQAQAVAQTRLALMRGRVEELSWQQIVDPALAPLDVVGLEQDDESVDVYVIDQVTTPLSPTEAQTAVTRSALTEV